MSDGVRVALFFAALFAAAAINTAFLPLWFADRGLSAVAMARCLARLPCCVCSLVQAGGRSRTASAAGR